MVNRIWKSTIAWFLAFLTLGVEGSVGQINVDSAGLPPPAKTKIDFERDVAPILRKNCLSCHGPDKQMGGLRLDTRQAVLAGGYSGAVISLGNSARSKLIHLVAGVVEERLVMPLGREKLSAQQVGLLRAWIDQGVEWSMQSGANWEADGKGRQSRPAHWAFIPPQKSPVPRVRNHAWVRNSLDAFVLARLEAEGINPSPEAERTTLLRRVSLDLIGLPPTPEEVSQFVSDKRPEAYERLVDRLLASPHYGEKWASHWLDQARFAESDGYQADFVRPWAWRWRHWVIEAFNRNLPFDQFTIEQIAGDLLPNAKLEQVIATGFHRNTLTNRESGFPLEMDRVDQVFDRTNTFGIAWLGLTIGCARCHDHKFDPITQKEYYQLYAFFNTVEEVNVPAPLPGELEPYLQRKAAYDRKWHELMVEYGVPELQTQWEQIMMQACSNPDDPSIDLRWKVMCEELRFELDGIRQSRISGGEEILRIPPSERSEREAERLTRYFIYPVLDRFVGKERFNELRGGDLRRKLADLDARFPALSETQTVADNPALPSTHVLVRGDFRQPGIDVQPNTPSFLPPLPPDANNGKVSRLTLARWLVSKDNPLTARVAVNRIWQEFFGHGLVTTSDDFGTRGDRPTHPELLDWLAVEFMDTGWDVKKMHKLIVTSATYRQSARPREDLQSRDPDNIMLARQARLRLSAELIRDVTLSAGGLLNPAIGGKSIRPPMPVGVTDVGFADYIKWPESDGADRYRRGIYIFRQRTLPYPQLVTFDAPNTLTPRCQRERSTTPLQALTLMNDPVFFEAAQALAGRILREKSASMSDRINYAFKLCLARSPKPLERERLIRYYYQQKQILEGDRRTIEALVPAGFENIEAGEVAIWVGISGVLLNLEEFMTRG